MSVIEKLITIQSCKDNIKQAITDKGVDMTDVAFTDYATKISEIQTGGGSGDPEGGSADYLELRANLRDYQSNAVETPMGAFAYCDTLRTVDLPMCEYVRDVTFKDCYSLTSIDLPNCYSVGSYTFEQCHSLQTVNIPKVEIIGSDAFKNCQQSLASIDLPNCIQAGTSAFEGCMALTKVNIPKLTEIPANMFKNCYSLGGDFESPTPFHIDLPSVQIINDSAFSPCHQIKSISAPNLTRIGSNAFNQCGSLDTLDISESYWCDLVDINAFEGTPLLMGMGEIHVPNSSLSKYQNDLVWSVLSERFVGVDDKTLLAFDNGRLYGDTAVLNDNFTDFLGIMKEDVTSIDLPNCLKIGDSMFMSCNLQSIDLPNCLEIGDSAFSQNASLSSVNLPKCERLGMGAFDMCNLTSIDLPNCLEIGDSAFQGNAQLSSVNLPKCERLGTGAFGECNLTSVDLPNCLEIGTGALGNNMQLSSVNLPKCEIIGQFAISSSEALTSIDLPNIKYIADYAFAFNMNLKTITIGNTESVCELEGISPFENSPIETIYVPNNLVNQYKSHMYWGQFAHMIVGI